MFFFYGMLVFIFFEVFGLVLMDFIVLFDILVGGDFCWEMVVVLRGVVLYFCRISCVLCRVFFRKVSLFGFFVFIVKFFFRIFWIFCKIVFSVLVLLILIKVMIILLMRFFRLW